MTEVNQGELIVRPNLDGMGEGYVRLRSTLGNDLSVVNAARVSFDKRSEQFEDRDQGLLNFLIREGHTSPLRHAAIQLEVYAPLFVARQWWKHIVGGSYHSANNYDTLTAWNESSRRYITEDEKFMTVFPEEWRSAPENKKQGSGEPLFLTQPDKAVYYSKKLRSLQDQTLKLYNEAMEDGIAPEQARLFLPAYGLYVRFVWTTSLQSALHFLDLRLDNEAQYEIREYANAVHTIVENQFPKTLQAWKKHKQESGGPLKQ